MRFFPINRKFELQSAQNDLHRRNFLSQKKDVVLILGILLLSAVSALLILLIPNNTGSVLRITTDQKLYGEYDLLKDQVIVVEQSSGYNQIVIKDGAAYIKDADCPDKYCMEYHPISKGNEVIICLPHKLVIEVIGETTGQEPDVIAVHVRERESIKSWQKGSLTVRCFLHWQWYLDMWRH